MSATDRENVGTLCAATVDGVRNGRALWRGACDARQTRTDGQTNTRARAIWDAIILTLQSVAAVAAEAGRRRIRSVVVRARARSSGTKNVNQLVAAAVTIWCRGRKNTIPPERAARDLFFPTRDAVGSVGRSCLCAFFFTSPRTLATSVYRLNRRRRRRRDLR